MEENKIIFCKECGKESIDNSPTKDKEFCSRKCFLKFNRIEFNRKSMERKRLKRKIEKINDTRKYVCALCGKDIEKIGLYKRRRFCSVACKVKDWKIRHPNYIDKNKYVRLKKWRRENKEKYRIAKNRQYRNRIKRDPLFAKRESERIMKLRMKRMNIDKEFYVRERVRNSFTKALRIYCKTGKITKSKMYGIDYKLIAESLKPFPKDIENWHIDHIIPLVRFNLNNLEEIKKAFAPNNLQWLPALENIRKKDRTMEEWNTIKNRQEK